MHASFFEYIVTNIYPALLSDHAICNLVETSILRVPFFIELRWLAPSPSLILSLLLVESVHYYLWDFKCVYGRILSNDVIYHVFMKSS